MTQAMAQALVMRALADPAFLAALRAGDLPAGLGPGHQAAARALDAERLYLFGGFLTRVQNNPLRPLIPFTLDLLARLDLEIALFAAYRAPFLRLRADGALSPSARLDAFAAFVASFTAEHPWHGLIAACLHHERLIAQGAAAADGAAVAPSPPASGGPSAVPAILGRMRLADYPCDPDGLARFLHDRAGLPDGAPLAALRRPTTVLYWRRDRHAALVVAGVDGPTAALLRAIDGRRPVAAIPAAAGVDAATAAAFFDTAVRQGLVCFTDPEASP